MREASLIVTKKRRDGERIVSLRFLLTGRFYLRKEEERERVESHEVRLESESASRKKRKADGRKEGREKEGRVRNEIIQTQRHRQ